MHLDTCFLIDLQKEKICGMEGAAHRFLSDHADEPMSCSTVVISEYCEGFQDDELWKAMPFLSAFECVSVDFQVALKVSRIRRTLRKSGNLLPDNDLFIAACALEKGSSLVTENPDHFRRIEGLDLIGYRS